MVTETKPKKRKKRPPPKKKPPVAEQVRDIIADTTVEVLAVNDDDQPSKAWLKRMAELMYVTTQSAVSVKKIHDMPEFKGRMHLITMGRWCREGRWLQKRDEYFTALQEKIKARVASATVQSRVKQLKLFEGMFLDVLEKLAESEPGTYEGMVGAAIKLAKAMEDLRTLIAEEVVPASHLHMLGTVDGPTITPELTHGEARAAALAIIEERRANKPPDKTELENG